MEIATLRFAGFVVLVLLVYYLLSHPLQNAWLLLASYVFYITWAWQFALILLVLTLGNYLLAQQLRREDRRRMGLLWMGIAGNLLALAFFKYASFWLPELLSLLNRLGVSSQAGGMQILLPVGLSFYVLGVISYLLDVSRGQMPASRSLVDFALYMAYFPKLLAGPIERARSFIPQMARPRIVDNQTLARGAALVVMGMARKVVIADTLAVMFPAAIFTNPQKYSAISLAVWLLAYAFSLYNDFAGYTDIVRGVSLFFGIELTQNFKSPYFSRSFMEFWNRWHISLSHWLRDYIYYPTARGIIRRIPKAGHLLNLAAPPLITMLASGLWHQASWNLLLWGGLHGLYLAIERGLSLSKPVVPPDQQPRWKQGFSMLLVFSITVLTWVPFRMQLPVALAYWQHLFTWTDFIIPDKRLILVLALAMIVEVLLYLSQGEVKMLGWPRLAQATLLAVAILAIFMATRADTGAPFIYQGF